MNAVTWAIIALLISFNGLFVAAEFAAVSVGRSRVRQMAEEGNRFARMFERWGDMQAVAAQSSSAAVVLIALRVVCGRPAGLRRPPAVRSFPIPMNGAYRRAVRGKP